jgi:HEAT repeat protein
MLSALLSVARPLVVALSTVSLLGGALLGCSEKGAAKPTASKPTVKAVPKQAAVAKPASKPRSAPKEPAPKPKTLSIALDCGKLPKPQKVYRQICDFKTPSKRQKAVLAVVAMKAEALDPLRRVLGGPNDIALRSWSVLALKAMGPAAKDALPELIAALDDRSAGARIIKTTVVSTLAALGPAAKPATPALLRFYRRSPASNLLFAAEAFAEIGALPPEIDKALVAGLSGKKGIRRAMYVKTLGRLSRASEKLEKALGALLNDGHAKTRIYAAAALYRMSGYKTEAHLKTLQAALSAKDWLLRQGAVLALGEVCGKAPKAVELLLGVAETEQQPFVLASLARALAHVPASKKTLATLTKMVATPGPMPSRAAIMTLGKLGPPAKGALPQLRRIAQEAKGSKKGQEAQAAIAKIAP